MTTQSTAISMPHFYRGTPHCDHSGEETEVEERCASAPGQYSGTQEPGSPKQSHGLRLRVVTSATLLPGAELAPSDYSGAPEVSEETEHWRGKPLFVNNSLPLQCIFFSFSFPIPL